MIILNSRNLLSHAEQFQRSKDLTAAQLHDRLTSVMERVSEVQCSGVISASIHPSLAFSGLKAATTAFTFKTLS